MRAVKTTVRMTYLYKVGRPPCLEQCLDLTLEAVLDILLGQSKK